MGEEVIVFIMGRGHSIYHGGGVIVFIMEEGVIVFIMGEGVIVFIMGDGS